MLQSNKCYPKDRVGSNQGVETKRWRTAKKCTSENCREGNFPKRDPKPAKAEMIVDFFRTATVFESGEEVQSFRIIQAGRTIPQDSQEHC